MPDSSRRRSLPRRPTSRRSGCCGSGGRCCSRQPGGTSDASTAADRRAEIEPQPAHCGPVDRTVLRPMFQPADDPHVAVGETVIRGRTHSRPGVGYARVVRPDDLQRLLVEQRREAAVAMRRRCRPHFAAPEPAGAGVPGVPAALRHPLAAHLHARKPFAGHREPDGPGLVDERLGRRVGRRGCTRGARGHQTHRGECSQTGAEPPYVISTGHPRTSRLRPLVGPTSRPSCVRFNETAGRGYRPFPVRGRLRPAAAASSAGAHNRTMRMLRMEGLL